MTIFETNWLRHAVVNIYKYILNILSIIYFRRIVGVYIYVIHHDSMAMHSLSMHTPAVGWIATFSAIVHHYR